MIAFYISGHGFGHASRDVEALNALGRLAPSLPITICTAAPRWLFDLTLTREAAIRPCECDTGVVQIDSVSLDEAETMRRAEAFYRDLPGRAAEEARWLQSAGARLVVADIPPLACAAAAAAGVPAIALGNFTWDWIYDGYRAWLSEGSDLIDALGRMYSGVQLGLRLPMHGGFGTVGTRLDLPFVARRSGRDPRETRARLGLPSGPLVLLSFGGYGLQRIDLGAIAGLEGYAVVLTADVTANRRADQPAPSADLSRLPPNVRLVDEHGLYADGLRYEDLVAAVDIVMTKPGYGIIAECIANDTALVYTSRGHFVEYDVLVREMPRWLRTTFISNDDLLAGRWQSALDDVLAQPAPLETIGVDGAERAAELILETMERR